MKCTNFLTYSGSRNFKLILNLQAYFDASMGNEPLALDMKSMGKGQVLINGQSIVTVSNATNDFSFTNKIGEGGFGPVYKGVLSSGQQIAVKKDSKDSGQGIEEFKNEVILIAKLQHQNLLLISPIPKHY
ncbi:hypothetical protein ACH5RR_005162 [Cinchona calisaya]|uniref:Protein kinase domain-containing protein n=1 Tax=Cinchona calisaya TaxID=153742 RepID=A0ABD3AKG8_9GENT